MNDEDDTLGIDLDAWQPPPPPSVADGVVARMRRENTAVTAQALPVETPRRPLGKRWWIAGAATVAIAASTVLAFTLTRGPEDARGVSAGDRAAHIQIGPTTADIDPDTAVSWRRDGDRITAKQAGGAAAWRVDEDDTLTIETGLASIQATDASLRVEVQMLDGQKTIALSALTAAAVAAVTIVVYEGVVKTNGTTVPPGTAFRVTAEGQNVIEQEMVAGNAAELQTRISTLEAELAQAKAELDAARKQLPTDFDRDPVHRTTRCDPDALKSQGQEMYALGRPADALVFFERLDACEPNTPNTLMLVMASACKSKNLAKARVYWKKMNEASKNAIESLCVMNGFSREDLDGADATMGRLLVTNAEPAKVLLDGVAVGTTPLSVEVGPGKRKVTLVVGADKYTFSVLVKAGETTRLEKELR